MPNDQPPMHARQTYGKDDIGSDEFLRSIPGAHEYMAAESERLQRRPPTVELSPDYGAEMPLWPQEDVTDSLVPAELKERLLAWQQVFEANFEPPSGWKSMTIKSQWAETAVQLEADLRAAVDGRVEVEVDLWPLNPGFVHTSQLNRPPMI